MNANLDQQLQSYLVHKTKYAVILTGGWGTGKTHYIKTAFSEVAKRNKFTAVHVSLFGVSTIDQIKDQIFLQLYPIFDNTVARATGTILKAVVKVADLSKLISGNLTDKTAEAAGDIEKEINRNKFRLSKLKKLVICFDDLERAQPDKLTANEILGFINGLVEEEIKVVMIANEGQLFEKEKYDEIKEKTIHQTIHFKQNFDEVFEAVLSYEDHHPNYLAFLREQKSAVKAAFKEQEQVNLRTLAYFISFFGDVFSFVDQKLNIKALQKHHINLLKGLLDFSLMIVAEFKNGHITYTNDRGLQDGLTVSMIDYLANNRKGHVATYAEETIKRYYQKDNFYFYRSVFDYLTGGNAFNGEELRKEIYEQYHVESDAISPAYQVYNKLSDRESIELADNVYKRLTAQLKAYALADAYRVEEYVSVFYYIVRHGNVLRVSPDRLSQQLVSVVKRKKAGHEYNPMIKAHLSSVKDSEYHLQLEPIADAVNLINDEALKRTHLAYAAVLERQMLNDSSALFDRLLKESQEPFNLVSLDYVRPKIFFKSFKKADNKGKQSLLHILYLIFDKKFIEPGSAASEFLAGLQDLLTTYLGIPKNERSNSGYIAAGMLKFVKEKRKTD